MTGLSKTVVVEQIVAQLAERRRVALGRRDAYLALCLAILADDLQEPVELSVAEHDPSAMRRSGSAA